LIDRSEEYNFDLLRQYQKLFPNEALAGLIQTYLAYLGVPFSDEEEETPTPSASLDDVFSAISVCIVPCVSCVHLLTSQKQKTESALQSSIFSRRVMAEVYLHDQDYQATITVSEAGLELVNRHRDDTGSDLILYVTSQLQSLIDDSAQCPKSVQCCLGNIARSPIPSQTSH